MAHPLNALSGNYNVVMISNVYHVQVLAVNAAKDATELVAKLRSYHVAAQTKADKKHLSR